MKIFGSLVAGRRAIPEFRQDPILGRWVIIATERARRPSDYAASRAKGESKAGAADGCPFCPGNEPMTPPEVLAFREGGGTDGPDWWVRVVPNKFPALRIEGELTTAGDLLDRRMSGVGAHEVIIETPEHERTLADLPVKQVREVLWACRERLCDLKGDKRFRYGLVFKNHGREAGASLSHPHCQLIALPVVPVAVEEEIAGALAYHQREGRCVYCDLVEREAGGDERLVARNEDCIAFTPHASRFPFETWVVPRAHQSHFELEPSPEQFTGLAALLGETLARIGKTLGDPPYNFIIHTAPFDAGPLAHYHWHVEIMPQLTQVAGFEWGSGFYINPTPPEDAARYLRDVNVKRKREKQTVCPRGK